MALLSFSSALALMMHVYCLSDFKMTAKLWMLKKGVVWVSTRCQGSSVFSCPDPGAALNSLQAQATDCWHEQRSWTYQSARLLPCSTPAASVCSVRASAGSRQSGWGQAGQSLPVRPWRKTPPRALIATTRSRSVALSRAGLVVWAGNLLLFIDW